MGRRHPRGDRPHDRRGRRHGQGLRAGDGADRASGCPGVDPREAEQRRRTRDHRLGTGARNPRATAVAGRRPPRGRIGSPSLARPRRRDGHPGGRRVRVSVPRWLIVSLAAVFSAYHLVLAVASLDRFTDPLPVVACMVLYAAATVAVLWPSRHVIMPVWLASFCLAVSIVLPLVVTSELDSSVKNGYATWYVAAVGTLMVIVSTRRRQGFAWLGVGFMAAHGVLWAGAEQIADLGIVGSVVWVAFSHAMSSTLTRAGRETREFILAEHEAADWQAAQEAHVNERQYRLLQTGRTARPMLQTIVDRHGDLTAAERQECLNLEGAIRDEIRGRRLLDDDVRHEVMAARRRGGRRQPPRRGRPRRPRANGSAAGPCRARRGPPRLARRSHHRPDRPGRGRRRRHGRRARFAGPVVERPRPGRLGRRGRGRRRRRGAALAADPPLGPLIIHRAASRQGRGRRKGRTIVRPFRDPESGRQPECRPDSPRQEATTHVVLLVV
ncbi:membrane hypothetical protein [Frigoribacterium sp. 9N]|nr:membrane hypothetical protein [Frigoribacterium sp. 9N]